MPQVSAAVLRSTPSSTSASANIRRAAALSFSPLAALRSSEAVRASRVIETAVPIDAAPSQKPASSQSLTDLGIPNESQFRAVGISPRCVKSSASSKLALPQLTTASSETPARPANCAGSAVSNLKGTSAARGGTILRPNCSAILYPNPLDPILGIEGPPVATTRDLQRSSP